jgi:flagellar biosynthesis GTPase FlhF
MDLFEDMYGEKEKITFALELAIQEVTKAKKQAEVDPEEMDEDAKREASMKDKTKNLKKKGFIGVHSIIKLPFVIGTEEFAMHPFAGIVYQGLGSKWEQEDHHQEEE